MPTKQSHQKTWVEVSRAALRSNAQAIAAHVKPANVMAVVKSNAYGHGLVEVAKTVLPNVQWFGVDAIDEGIALRRTGIKKPVLILGYTQLERLRDCSKHNLSFVAYNVETLKKLKRLGGKPGTYNIHVPIETGTTRQGLYGDELEAFVKLAKTIPSLTIEGVYTHFANIEDTTDPSYAMGQLKKYQNALRDLKRLGVEPSVTHTAASAAAIVYPETRFGMIRLGISLYGHWPSKETQIAAKMRTRGVSLTPALTWKTVVAQVKEAKRGTPVSYGLTERVSRDSVVAVLPVGYWDGVDRRFSSVGNVLIRGHRCKVLGRVCMNMMMADVTDVPGVRPEDEVVLIGSQGKETITAEEAAAKIGTIQYELLTRINSVIERRLCS